MTSEAAVDAFIQVRRGSSRLPDKAFAQLGEATCIAHIVTRLLKCTMLRNVVVCTSTLAEDRLLVEEAERLGVPSFQGDLHDCLDRFGSCADELGTEVIVRVCGDAPLVCPSLLDAAIRDFLGGSADYMGSTALPVGTYFEIFTTLALKKAARAAVHPEDSADLTYFIGRSEINDLSQFEPPSEYRRKDVMLALNRTQDLDVLREVFARAPREKEWLTLIEAIRFLDAEPELKAHNVDYTPKTRPEDVLLDPSRLQD